VFQLDYDPRMLSYEQLLDQLFAGRAARPAYSRQYMQGVFCTDAKQEAAARARGLAVPIVPNARFYLAEDYHQKYYLRHDSILMKELAGYSPKQFVESTVAARLNGYVAGSGTPAQLREELPQLGLSSGAVAHLEKLVGQRARITCG